MVTNVGSLDRVIRLIAGLGLIALVLLGNVAMLESSTMKIVALAIGAILAATGLFKFCPLYKILGKSTCKA